MGCSEEFDQVGESGRLQVLHKFSKFRFGCQSRNICIEQAFPAELLEYLFEGLLLLRVTQIYPQGEVSSVVRVPFPVEPTARTRNLIASYSQDLACFLHERGSDLAVWCGRSKSSDVCQHHGLFVYRGRYPGMAKNELDKSVDLFAEHVPIPSINEGICLRERVPHILYMLGFRFELVPIQQSGYAFGSVRSDNQVVFQSP